VLLTIGLIIISRIFERVEKYIKKQQENK
jgi:hypothetical protein